ncbi:hypothetical protein PAMP_002375 [Pampus punctatissimus]
MRNLWLLFTVGLATGFISEKLLVSSQSPSSTVDDLYLEGRMSGDFPLDDEDNDFGSGSGSGDYGFSDIPEEILKTFFNFFNVTFIKGLLPLQPQPVKPLPTEASYYRQPTTAADSQNVPSIIPTANWFPRGTSPSSTSMPPSETTDANEDNIVGDPTEDPTDDLFPHSTSPSSTSMPPSETTDANKDNIVGDPTDDPTDDLFPHSTSPSSTSMPPSETTDANKDNIVGDPTDDPTDNWFPRSTIPSSTSMPPSETTDVSVTTDANKGNILDGFTDIVLKKVGIKHEAKNHLDSSIQVPPAPDKVTSESIWERTDVLAAVIACGVVGFICAVSLLLFLVYRMKKKDEGSYNLGETKLPTTAYHKAPTKEFYA